jgi:capsular polysaccharide biosynthesis protein
MSGKRFYFVQMINRVDARDSEVWKIHAESTSAAQSMAIANDVSSRFNVGSVIKAYGNVRRIDRKLAQELSSYCVRVFGRRKATT